MEKLINHNLSLYLKELREVKEKIKFLESERKDILYMIDQEMKEHDVLISSDGVILATYERSTRRSLNMDEFKKALPDVYEVFLKETETRIFRLKGE